MKQARTRTGTQQPRSEPTPVTHARVPVRRTRAMVLGGLLLVTLLAGVMLGPAAVQRYCVNEAEKALQRHNLTLAEQWIERAGGAGTTHPDVHFWRARLARRQGRISEARLALEQVTRFGGDPVRVERENWLIAAQVGELVNEEARLQTLFTNPEGDEPAICEAFVNGYLRNYRFGDALPMLAAWEADFPEDSQAPFCRGLVWLHMKLTKKAAEQFQRAAELAPHRRDVRLAWAAALSDLHEYDAADRLYAACYAEQPRDLSLLVGWANCLLALGQMERVEKLLQEASGLDANSLQVLLLQGRVAISQGRPTDALQPLEVAERLDPRHPDVRYELGTALQMLARREEAKPHLEYAQAATLALNQARTWMGQIQENPRLVEPRYQVGLTLLQYGAAADGLAWLRSVLQLEPNHAQALAAIEAHTQTGTSNPQ
jgi:tetratricopeptide (TPR) repeat protein